VAYIEFAKGETKGSVRLTEADAAEKYIAKVEEGKVRIPHRFHRVKAFQKV